MIGPLEHWKHRGPWWVFAYYFTWWFGTLAVLAVIYIGIFAFVAASDDSNPSDPPNPGDWSDPGGQAPERGDW